MLAANSFEKREGRIMKILTATRVAALAVGLSLAAGQAFADPSEGRGDRDKKDNASSDQTNTNDKGDRGNRHGRKQQDPKATGVQTPVVAPVIQATPQNNGSRVNVDRRGHNDQANDRGYNNRNARYNDRHRDWGNNDRRDWRNQDRRRVVDMSRYNRNFNAPRRYNVGIYAQPYGYSYRRYSYGQRLPGGYFVQRFWLLDFLNFGLFAPPPGYIWVRYGPDALLIDEETGEIVQVRYNMFYS
jgi:Ni/Co efflux regulator RcnB